MNQRTVKKADPLNPLWLIGLGNPGPQYAATRHNAGYWVVDRMMRERQLVFRRLRFSLLYQARLPENAGERPIVFLRWSGYMNESGGALSELRRRHVLNVQDIFVIVDNMDIPPGACRLKRGGGDAGHNGLKSLIRSLGTGDFNRLYIGIGRPAPGWEVVNHVLGRPSTEDMDAMESACRRAATALWALSRGEAFESAAEHLKPQTP
ncbi:MAG: aminoacyl-tRNA hydrolase [Spirochaeta sp. LUC14_002_19_P3]|nr:MAG: aminoacyl-tRNA hydrolase [Spirochaeta sp. LUC14_002_19_P3]